MNDLAKMSGENESGGPPKLILNQIRINGKTGNFIFEDIKSGAKEEEKGKKVYRKTVLGKEITVTFLKVRRKLVQFRKDKKSLTTTEHNHPGCRVVLFGDTTESGIASEIREAYPMLKTQQIVYGLYKDELVRIIIKGASLGSKNKEKTVEDFYSYIGKAFDKSKDEHFYNFETEMYSKEESGDLGSYYCASFKKGDKIEDLTEVSEKMKQAYDYCMAYDDYYVSKFVKESNGEVAVKKDVSNLETIEYPEEEVEGEIPF